MLCHASNIWLWICFEAMVWVVGGLLCVSIVKLKCAVNILKRFCVVVWWTCVCVQVFRFVCVCKYVEGGAGFLKYCSKYVLKLWWTSRYVEAGAGFLKYGCFLTPAATLNLPPYTVLCQDPAQADALLCLGLPLWAHPTQNNRLLQHLLGFSSSNQGQLQATLWSSWRSWQSRADC